MSNIIRNEVYENGVVIEADIYNFDTNTYQREENSVIVITRPITIAEIIAVGPQPLSSIGALATLLAVTQVVSVEDAASAVGLTPRDLEIEAQAWAAAQQIA